MSMLKQRLGRCFRFAVNHMAGKVIGRRDYTRFIILSTGRSGTNFLRGLLNSHTSAIAFGEIFRFPATVGWDMCRRKTVTPGALQTFINDPATFVDQHVYMPYPQNIRAVGFKLFYDHAPNPPHDALWPYLASCQDLHIIHMQRDNLFKRLVSRERARADGQWIQQSANTNECDRTITIPYEECLKDFQAVEGFRQQHKERFSAHPYMELTYEQLAGNTQRSMERVFDFLGLPPKDVVPNTRKQRKTPPAECVANYAELAERFADTPYGRFFQD